jgi:hypothetical protein
MLLWMHGRIADDEQQTLTSLTPLTIGFSLLVYS